MTPQQLWEEYARTASPAGIGYDAWQFGCDPDGLAALVAAGTKTATAGLLYWYEAEGEPLPRPGQYSVVLNSRDEAVCIIRTSRVYTAPFCDVAPDHAFREGEGDRSLDYWRAVHRAFFAGELAAAGLPFEETLPVVCEEFELVYRAP